MQPDGKIIAAGGTYNGSGQTLTVCRFTTTGAFDVSFGNRGSKVSDAGGTADVILGIAVRTDGKIMANGSFLPNSGSYKGLFALYNTNGALNTTFGFGGIQSTVAGGIESRFYQLAIQPDGNCVTAGYRVQSDGLTSLDVVRIKPAGTPDPTFGNQTGQRLIPVAAGNDVPSCMAIGPDGKLFMGCISWRDQDDALIYQYDADAQQQTVYHLNPVLLANQDISGIAIQADGKILAAGSSYNNSTQFNSVERFKTDGTPDPTYGQSGIVNLQIPHQYAASLFNAALQPDGKLLTCGYFLSDSAFAFYAMVLRLLPNGTLDPSWGNNGVAALGNPEFFQAFGLALQPDHKVVVVGQSFKDSSDLFVGRFDATGQPDQSFGSGGYIITHFNNAGSIAYDVQIDAAGRILVAGNSTVKNGKSTLKIFRYLNDGTPDPSFGTNGLLSIDAGTPNVVQSIREPSHVNVRLQPDNKILISSTYNSQPHSDIRLYRLSQDGSLDNSFGIGGAVTTDVFGNDELNTGMLVQSDNKIIVSAAAYNGTDFDAVLIRYLPGLIIGTHDLTKNATDLLVYPNPIQDHTQLQFENPTDGKVTVQLEDLQGRLIQNLFNAALPAGKQTLQLDFQAQLPAGNYVCRVVTENGQAAIRVTRI